MSFSTISAVKMPVKTYGVGSGPVTEPQGVSHPDSYVLADLVDPEGRGPEP